MIKKLLFFCYAMILPAFAYAESNGTYQIADFLTKEYDDTKCATAIFSQALADNAHMIEEPEYASTAEIDVWAHYAFSQPEVLQSILNCPEMKKYEDDDTIIFEPASYTFPNGRNIKINYEAQKSVLKQRIILANKRELSTSDISPNVGSDIAGGTVWINVDPAWYAILVAEHGSLDEYVGQDKNNVVAVNHIEQNIDKYYPKDHAGPFRAECTSRSAIAGDTDMVNRAVTITVGGVPPHSRDSLTEEEKAQMDVAEKNDFYVMGEANLQWIAALEITADVVLTVVTMGGFKIVDGALKAVRATRAFAKAEKALKVLRTSKNVIRYTRATKNAVAIERAIGTIDKISDSFRAISKLSRQTSQTVRSLTTKLNVLKTQKADAKTIKAVEKELELATKQADAAKEAMGTAEKLSKAEQTLKNGKALSPEKQKQMDTLIQNLEKANQHKQELANLKPGQKLDRKAWEKVNREIKTNQQKIQHLKKETILDPKEAQQIEKEMAELKNTYAKQLENIQKSHGEELKVLEKTKDVKNYKKVTKARRDVAHTAYLLRQSKIAFKANRGLLPVRAFKAAKALRRGLKSAKNLDKSVRVIRANTSGISAKINDLLFHSTMKALRATAKIPATIQALNMIVKIAGDMYDATALSTGEFTNNIDMKPYLLLGADDLEGYENVVNQGMWLFWAGSSTSAADDDAAFLQAMSFAEKFHQDLVELQDDYNVMACDVDIYVVRPIIRNPDTPNAELYYLFMNDSPWTTHGYNEPNDGTGETSIPLRRQEEPVGTASATHDVGEYTEPEYDGSKIGQACTPPSTSAGIFTNAVLTTGRYSNYPAFEKAMITKFRTEGGCGDHPADRGGYTCYGVSSKFFPQAKNPNFSRADAEDIAFNRYYKAYNLDKLPDAISGDVFMALWGTGSHDYAIKLLQRLLGVSQTGFVNQETIDAAKNYDGDLRTQYLDARERHFSNGQKEFRQGWLNALELYRANGCHTQAQ